MALVEDIYVITKGFPADERFGLTAQVRRAIVSVPSNVGEGARRKRRKAFLHHLDIALGSQAEVEVQIEIARRLQHVSSDAYARLQPRIEEVGKMLNGLINSLQNDEDRKTTEPDCEPRTTNHPTTQLSNYPTIQLSNYPTTQLSN